MSLAPGCGRHSGTRLDVCARVRLPTPCERAHDGGAWGELTLPQGQAVSDDLNAPLITDRHIQVHVGQSHMAGDPSTGFVTDSCDGMLKGQCAHVARTPEVAQAERWSPSVSSSPWQRHLRGARRREVAACAAEEPGTASRRTRKYQRPRRRCKVSKVRLEGARFAGPGGKALPSLEKPGVAGGFSVSVGRRGS